MSHEPDVDAEELCCYGIIVMIVLRVVVIGWLGLDADAWYVWPWTWVAFGLMAPVILEWINESRASR